MVKFSNQNFWFNKPLLQSDEQLLFEIPANHSQGKRAVGGKLFATNERLIFVPNRMDSLMGGKAAEIPRGIFGEVSVEPPVYSITEMFSGAFRSRLRVSTTNDESHLFVVNQLNKTIELFRQYKFN